MGYKINGTIYSYDYEEFIREIKEDLDDGLLATDSIIEVLRDDKAVADGNYNPIIDYYYPNALNDMKKPLETYNIKDEYTNKEWEKMLQEQADMIAQYNEDKPNLEVMTVLAMLTEMEEWNRILF